ncbi:uncharacterized protein HMPREF1541_02052 [Cyphellophora europaea CBS 101466]|uniref:Uncharacterized protein n=1 Tax=Cyphellophora europaea (strain CBS 101466) TaxID=1220924 RepID=W2S4N2_CYPE1|nr:uncharacterized protein HMPREF1541_02052 [Cyphellophora europaea CBS 101466]ETN42894.1 hypothetical protein HMPREF1541_02052 [Cyphellophora europaea CBS 101466]
MRGGLDTLGWSGSLKQAIETVTSFVKFQTKTQTPASSPNPTEETTTSLKLDYPTHPFPTDLSATISKLPFGFSDMALARTLSVQTIDLLVDVHEQDLAQRTQQPNNSTSSPSRKRLYTADKCLQLLKSTSMPEPERMIVGGLLAYTVQSQPPASRTTFYDESLMSLLAELAQYTFFNYEHPSLLWIVMCFSVLQDHLTQGSRVDFFHHTVLRFRQSTRWSRMEKTLKEFLWTDERLREWKWAWEDAIGSHRPMGYESRTPSKSPEIEGFARDGVVTPAPSIDRYANLRPPMEVGLQIKMEE